MTSLLAEITMWTLILCVVAAFIAGFVDAVAGGGGLIQLPVLLLIKPLMFGILIPRHQRL